MFEPAVGCQSEDKERMEFEEVFSLIIIGSIAFFAPARYPGPSVLGRYLSVTTVVQFKAQSQIVIMKPRYYPEEIVTLVMITLVSK